jgi:hypothetical protein
MTEIYNDYIVYTAEASQRFVRETIICLTELDQLAAAGWIGAISVHVNEPMSDQKTPTLL